MANKIRRDDEVVVIAGKIKVNRQSLKLSLVKTAYRRRCKFSKETSKPILSYVPGGIIEKEASIHVSNVAILNPKREKLIA